MITNLPDSALQALALQMWTTITSFLFIFSALSIIFFDLSSDLNLIFLLTKPVWQRLLQLPHVLKYVVSSVVCSLPVLVCCVFPDLQSATQIDKNSLLDMKWSICIASLFPNSAFLPINTCQQVSEVGSVFWTTLHHCGFMFLVRHNLCFGCTVENNVERNNRRIFRARISCLKWQEERGLQKAFLEAWIIFHFQKRGVLSQSAKCQPTCLRERQGFCKNIMLSMHPSPVSTIHMTTGNSWAKSKWFDFHWRKSHMDAFSSSLSFSLNHTVPTSLRLKATVWLTAPSSNVPLALPEQKRLQV